jgi:hypothetical protein
MLLLPLAIATSALAVLSDDSDDEIDLNDKFDRALMFNNPQIFMECVRREQRGEVLIGIAREWVAKATDLHDLEWRMNFFIEMNLETWRDQKSEPFDLDFFFKNNSIEIDSFGTVSFESSGASFQGKRSHPITHRHGSGLRGTAGIPPVCLPIFSERPVICYYGEYFEKPYIVSVKHSKKSIDEIASFIVSKRLECDMVDMSSVLSKWGDNPECVVSWDEHSLLFLFQKFDSSRSVTTTGTHVEIRSKSKIVDSPEQIDSLLKLLERYPSRRDQMSVPER